jgi:hypothetical protein
VYFVASNASPSRERATKSTASHCTRTTSQPTAHCRAPLVLMICRSASVAVETAALRSVRPASEAPWMVGVVSGDSSGCRSVASVGEQRGAHLRRQVLEVARLRLYFSQRAIRAEFLVLSGRSLVPPEDGPVVVNDLDSDDRRGAVGICDDRAGSERLGEHVVCAERSNVLRASIGNRYILPQGMPLRLPP